jgi:DNA-binding MarR family transcriptional regulator
MRAEDLSTKFVQVIPAAMSSYRVEIRGLASPELTVLQFRALLHISRGSCTNQDLSEHLGVLPSAMSRITDALVQGGYVARKSDLKDRRRIDLRLTAHGRARIQALKASTSSRFTERFKQLDANQRKDLARGLSVLEEIFR